MMFYFDMFIVDTLLGNFDRHNGNLGFLYNKITDKFEIAPVYDCGSCLFPRLTESAMSDILQNRDDVNSRVYNFPLSMIKINGNKINYFDFITSMENVNCNNAILRIAPQISIDKINVIINETPLISNVHKTFYQTIVKARYDKILLPALERLFRSKS
jgi:hypothetical protein